MKDHDLLSVERVGGFAGFGLPDSHLRSKGKVSISELSPEDLRVIDELFRRDSHLEILKPDNFLYHITRRVGNKQQTIVVPEENIPLSIRSCVKDTLE